MLQVTNISLAFGGRVLYKDVNLKFTKGNCYGIIGANGAGKSTLLKIITGEIEPNTGEISITPGERMSVLAQNQNAYDNETVLNTVLLGHKRLMDIQKEKDELYMKPDFSEEFLSESNRDENTSICSTPFKGLLQECTVGLCKH